MYSVRQSSARTWTSSRVWNCSQARNSSRNRPLNDSQDPVLPRGSGVDVGRVDPGVAAPVDQRVGGQLGAVVHADVLRPPPQGGDQLVEDRHGRVGGERTRRPGSQRLPRELVDNVQKPDLSAINGDVDLEVQRPHLIRPARAHPLMPPRADAPLLDHPRGAFQTFGDPQPAGALAVGHQPLPGRHRVRLTPPPPWMGGRNLPQPGPQQLLGIRRRPGRSPLSRTRLPDHRHARLCDAPNRCCSTTTARRRRWGLTSFPGSAP